MQQTLSVIIPTFNEEQVLEETIISLKKLQGIKEIIIADGGSTDNTCLIASLHNDIKFITAKKGRAQQMNCGAQNASGDILLFLHADTKISQAAINEIYAVVGNNKVVAGAFKIRFDNNAYIYKLIALTSNLRARWLKIFFGDQGIFVLKDIFEKINGFPVIAIMEELPFIKLVKRHGKLKLLDNTLSTSSRRFQKHGVWKTLFLMHKLKLLYYLGINPTILKTKYNDK